MYKYIDGISMGSPLGPVMANKVTESTGQAWKIRIWINDNINLSENLKQCGFYCYEF